MLSWLHLLRECDQGCFLCILSSAPSFYELILHFSFLIGGGKMTAHPARGTVPAQPLDQLLTLEAFRYCDIEEEGKGGNFN